MYRSFIVTSNFYALFTRPITAVALFIWILFPIKSLVSASPLSTTDAVTCCINAVPLTPGEIFSSWGGEDEVYRLRLPSPGLVTLELIDLKRGREPASRVQAQMDVSSGTGMVVEQSPIRLVLALTSAETLQVQIFAPEAYRLATEFVPAQVTEEVFRSTENDVEFLIRNRFFAADLPHKGDPEEVDPDPDGYRSGEIGSEHRSEGRLLADLITQGSATSSHKGEPEEVDPDPDGLGSVPIGGAAKRVSDPQRLNRPRVLFYEPSCGLGKPVPTEDHGDTMNCARLIGPEQSVAGELGSDSDVFAIVVEEVTTLEFFTRGDADPLGILYDSAGQEIARNDDGAAGRNFRMVQALAPGRYFIRVASAMNTSGSYRLQVKQVR